MTWVTIAEQWGSTPEEREAQFPCDGIIPGGKAFFRAVDVKAPMTTTFRWLCQLKIAPYSYDLLDNYGRQSPRMLTSGIEELIVGEPVMSIFRLHDFSYNDHLTLTISSRRARKLFGDLTVTYRVLPAPAGSRIVVKLVCEKRNALWQWLLIFGDFVMMRKQLLTVRELAEVCH